MPQYKLAYFDSRGRAEVARMLFDLGGIEYEDFRITADQWMTKYKYEMPCKTVPVLFIDGEPLTQCKAIARYVARETGLYGKTNLASSRIDAVMGVCDDFWNSITKYFRTQDPKEQETYVKLFTEKEAPMVCANLETLLKQNDGGNGFFVGETLTVADVFVFCDLEFVLVFVDNILDSYPKLAALHKRVSANDVIAKRIENRPSTKF